MINPGGEFVGEYSKLIKNCDVVEYNFHTPDIQGAIDVVGVDSGAVINTCYEEHFQLLRVTLPKSLRKTLQII